MSALDSLIAQLEDYRSIADDEIAEAVKANEALAIELNQDQLHLGLRADESKLPDYAPSTRARKKREGARYENMTLYDTGYFYDGFELNRISTDEHWMWSDDKKTGDLTDLYNTEIFGLAKVSLSLFRKKVLLDRLKSFREFMKI